MVLNTEWAQVEVIDLINDGSGLAFGIIGGRSTGVVVKTILPGGVADRDGRLQSGDHILQIGEVNLRGLGSEQVASVLRQCGVHVRLVVARPVETSGGDYQSLGSHAAIVPTKILGDPVELDKHLIENGYAERFAAPQSNYGTPFIYTGQDVQLHSITGLVDVVSNPLPIGAIPEPHIAPPASTIKPLPLDMALREPNLPETEIYNVQLKKDDLGLGITVAGYVCEKEEISGIFVKSISKGSAADLTGCIKINDRIIEVDGKSVIGCTNHQAVEILRSTGSVVTISFERYLRGPKYEQLQQAIKANELRPASPVSSSISSLPKVPLSFIRQDLTSSVTIEAEGESRTSFDFDSAVLLDLITPTEEEHEIVIDGKSMQFSIATHESIEARWKDRVQKDAQIIVTELVKEPSSGLGISLEGTVDVEQGEEVRPHHYIRSILPNGPVGKTGILKAGDELLEVNGIQLLGVNHVEVVSILKQLPNFVSLVCVRYPVPTRIINTAQDRLAFQERNILGESLQTLIPLQDKLVKAKSDTSIVSNVTSDLCNSAHASKSRSLEIITGLPMWHEELTIVEINKADRGLGFSILDYQDPLNPQETVIVIRSLVPGGVAQQDGRLIPGDRLMAVNDIDLKHASLDRAVQVLKGAPKGVVKIAVAKPVANNTVSYNSQDTDDDDQTCLEEFHECIEEYQECLEVVHICLDDDNSFNHSPCESQGDDLLGENDQCPFTDNNNTTNHQDNAVNSESEVDISFKSVGKTDVSTLDNLNNRRNFSKQVGQSNEKISDGVNKFILTCNDSSTLSDKPSSQKDGYETCVDESLSEDNCAKNKVLRAEIHKTDVTKVQNLDEDMTPTNSRSILVQNLFLSDVGAEISASDPCISFNSQRKTLFFEGGDDEFQSYANPMESSVDEFFLVQYPSESVLNSFDVAKSHSEPAVLDMPDFKVVSYRKCLTEYYNDFDECLAVCAKEELPDEDIFNDLFIPFRCQSAPDVLDSSFVTMTYDPGPDIIRRKSAFLFGHESGNSPMTIIRSTDVGVCQLRDTMLQKHWGSTQTVQVDREPGRSLGISIVGGRVDLHTSKTTPASETSLGIFVKNVVQDSPAGKTGKFKTGDRILEVGGVDLSNMTHDKAVEVIRNASNPVTFLIQSLMPWSIDADENGTKPTIEINSSQIKDNKLHDNQRSPSPYPESSVEKLKPPEIITSYELLDETKIDDDAEQMVDIPAQTAETEKVDRAVSSSEEESEEEEEDVRFLEGRTVTAKGVEIDRASAGNVRRSKEEAEADTEEEDDFGYTSNKVKKKYANLGNSILIVQLERSGQGLGLSLAGHKDRNCMAVFVCGLNPKGAAFRTGAIQVGDEILEVNGVVLHGRCHLNASAIIKGLSGPIFKVIILRRKAAINDIAVKPITQFPVCLADEASEEQFSNYPNVRTVTIKKGSQSLGIMIIEGKHAEVGQGIFISDIQEGSSAEKAGLEIGEMILSVNKDSLLGANYDTAANFLKRTEGLVTLVLSNPGKKVSTPIPTGELDRNSISKSPVGLKTGAPPSRPATPVPEPPADPSTCPILPGRETTIEVVTDNKGLGAFFVGGKDTLIPHAVVLLEIYQGGPADKDGRLQPGDQVLDVNGTPLRDVTNNTAALTLRQTVPKMKLVVFRPEQIQYSTVEVDLVKKSGKGLGLSVIARKNGKGVYVVDILSGGIADVDGRIMKGDILVAVNGQDVQNCSGEEAGAILKTVMGRVSLKLNRYKPAAR